MTNLMRASHQWASRPADERFCSLPEMLAFKDAMRNRATTKTLASRALEARAIGDDFRALEFQGVNGGPVLATNWAFDQVARLAKAPAPYLRRLPAPLAADNINFGLLARDVEDVGVMMLRSTDSDPPYLSAVTGPNYGRVWDATIISSIIDVFGDGVTGDFKVPGIYGEAVPVTKDTTTLYASDRDMFVFLADERHRIEIPDRRNGKPGSLARGFFTWNSEVGKTTFGVATFLFDYVCGNRIVWGAREYREVKVRHTSSAPERWLEEVAPAIEAYANSSQADVVAAVTAAKAAKIETSVEEFLKKRRQFSGKMAENVVAAFKADEGRPPETIFDVVTGITAYARSIPHQDQRVNLEREAGSIMDLAS